MKKSSMILMLFLIVGCVSLIVGVTINILSNKIEAMKEQTRIEKAKLADADVTFVEAELIGQGDWSVWAFNVTVSHPDTGWDDYADGWDVVQPNGSVLIRDSQEPWIPFTRLLAQPHENEQPFTTSQQGLVIFSDVTTVTVRAHDMVHGFGGEEIIVDLTAESGENFTVERP